jgi:hypothetical protein
VSELNDLWEFSKGQWAWVGGPNQSYPTGIDLTGIYGTEGQAAASNIPGSRDSAVSWMDAQGNLWMFGGEGYGSTNQGSELNDLWKYSTGEWTWVGGSNVANQLGSYGTLGTPAAGNIPGGRFGAVSWTDASGNMWLLGGVGADSVNTGHGYLNDLWVYQP